MAKRKNPHAVALGALGGKVGGLAEVPKGFAKMDPDRLSEVSRKAAEVRWGKKKPKAKKK